jgi:proteasome assembly chaperone (PAC2) family protein
LVEYQAFHSDYFHLTPDIQWDRDKPATHVSIFTIESPEQMNKPALLTLTGYGIPQLRHPKQVMRVQVAS